MKLTGQQKEVIVSQIVETFLSQFSPDDVPSLPNEVIHDHIIEMVDDVEQEVDNRIFSIKVAKVTVAKKDKSHRWWE